MILSNFYSADDLKQGIDVLQRYHVPILEIYLSKPAKGIEEKLHVKKLRLGHAAIKFGFPTGMVLSTLIFYTIERGWPLMNSNSAYRFIITLFLMVATFLFANYLFPGHAPKVINLPPSDGRFLIIVDAKSITGCKGLKHLFEYAEAIEMSLSIKKTVTI